MEAIANLMKHFVIQVVVFGNPVQNVLEMAALGENAGQETYLLIYLLTYLVSQTIDVGERDWKRK